MNLAGSGILGALEFRTVGGVAHDQPTAGHRQGAQGIKGASHLLREARRTAG
jgi:hypothetical protein